MSLAEGIHPVWKDALSNQLGRVDALEKFIDTLAEEGVQVLPDKKLIMRAFQSDPSLLKVVIVGQDPYPTPGHPSGLAFSVAPGVALPRSLVNISKELSDDTGETLSTGDLSSWESQGVMLLNRVLSVEAGAAGSHQKKGWEELTEQAVAFLAKQAEPPVFVLWGAHAQKLKTLLGRAPVIESAHPSPLSARRGFFGSKPFSKINTILIQRNQSPIRWQT